MPKKATTKSKNLAQVMKVRELKKLPVSSVSHLSTTYVMFLIVNLIVVFWAHQWFPRQVVLGTHMHTQMAALIYSMTVFTLMLVATIPIVEILAHSLKIKLSNWQWPAVYTLINFMALWFIARFAEVLGMGISSWLVVLDVALVLNVAQVIVYKFGLGKK